MILYLSDGRLGNQIFQYAFLNTIAKDDEQIVSIAMEKLSNTFDINNKNFKQITSNRYLNFILRKFIKPYVLNALVKLKLIGYIKQDKNEMLATLPSFKHVKGLFPIIFVESNYFQSECFFDKKAVDIKIKETFILEAKSILKSVSTNRTKVFVHVRRGDYLFEKYLGERGIDLPKRYFLDAIEIMKQKIDDPYFIFLSDDPSYCECCFSDIRNKYISENSMGIDLAMMTLCEYGIVSNSSFSWWGAYLMKNKKEVIFPKYWYGWKKRIDSHVDIQPEWGKLIEVVK